MEGPQDHSKEERARRLVGKLFGRKEKVINNEQEVDAFLHGGSSDKLYTTGTAPSPAANVQGRPMLQKLDTSGSSRWPSAQQIIQSQQPQTFDAMFGPNGRTRAATVPDRPPFRSRRRDRDLTVTWDSRPPITIGLGGDEFMEPTVAISQRKNEGYHQQRTQQPFGVEPQGQTYQSSAPGLPPRAAGRPSVADRTPTGHPSGTTIAAVDSREERDQDSLVAKFSRQMEISEGQALKRASAMPTQEMQDTLVGKVSAEMMNAYPMQQDTRSPVSPAYSRNIIPQPGQASQRSPERSEAADSRARGLSGTTRNDFSTATSPATSMLPAFQVDYDALEEFSVRITHNYKLFNLSAESVRQIDQCSFKSFLRAASWWFLVGSMAIRKVVNQKQPSGDLTQMEVMKSQGFADLAKCYWILDEILLDRPEIGGRSPEELDALEYAARAEGRHADADLYERYRSLYSKLRQIAASMMKYNIMPPPADEAILTQGLNTAIWIQYPWSDPEMQQMLAGVDAVKVLCPGGAGSMPLSEAFPVDNSEKFVYSTASASIHLSSELSDVKGFRLAVMFTTFRRRNETNLSAVMTTQDGQIGIYFLNKSGHRPNWKEIHWDVNRDFVDVKLGQGLRGRIIFKPGELGPIHSVYEGASSALKNLGTREDEDPIIETLVATAQYSGPPASFPQGRVPGCKVRLYEKTIVRQSKTGQERRHSGVRLALVSGSNERFLSSLSFDLPARSPIFFENNDNGSSKALILHLSGGVKLALTFEDGQEGSIGREVFQHCLVGGPKPNDLTEEKLTLTRMTFSGASDADIASTSTVLDKLQWSSVGIVRYSRQPGEEPREAQLPAHIRIVAKTKLSDRVSDRITMQAGELLIRVSSKGFNPSLSILRAPQSDMTISCNMRGQPGHGFGELLGLVSRVPTIRTYHFKDLQDLHTFQRILTGYEVRYDGSASTFSISRRRSVVPIHKKWEAQQPRIQILKGKNVFMVAVFFENFAHGECMNWWIKATDKFESFHKGGKHGLKFADAKFALPKMEDDKEEARVARGAEWGATRLPREEAFIHVTQVDYMTEHDDITVLFETEDGKSISNLSMFDAELI